MRGRMKTYCTFPSGRAAASVRDESQRGQAALPIRMQPLPVCPFDQLRWPQPTGDAMKKRSRPGAEPTKGRRRKAPQPKRRNAPKAASRSNPPPIAEETEVPRLGRDRYEAVEQLSAASDVLKVITSSPGDLKRVFDALRKQAANEARLQGLRRGRPVTPSSENCVGDYSRSARLHGPRMSFRTGSGPAQGLPDRPPPAGRDRSAQRLRLWRQRL